METLLVSIRQSRLLLKYKLCNIVGPLLTLFSMTQADLRKCSAEFFATLTLTLVVSFAVQSPVPEGAMFLAALTVAMFVYTVGPISGAHINPAVTVGLWSIGKIDKQHAVYYVVAQVLGAAVSLIALSALVGSAPAISGADGFGIAIAEALGALLLVFGVCSVAYGKTHQAASGLVVGGSLFLGIFIASGTSNGVINPAVAMGIGSLSFTYVLAPLVGGAVGAYIAKYMYS